MAALRDARASQERVLEAALRAHADTAFGRAHGFARVRDHADFAAAVPVHDYAALAPWIERAAAGERNVLTADDPLVFFTSSGSTGAHKKVPITPTFLRDCFIPFVSAFQAGVAEACPDVLARDDSTFSLKHDPGSATRSTASGRPHLGASQLELGEPGTNAPWSRLPEHVATEPTLARLSHRVRLAAHHDVRCVVGINPAQVAALPWLLAEWGEPILRDVRDGTLGGAPHRAPDPQRARRLERLAASSGALQPHHLWPRLELIVCWDRGLARLYLPAVRALYGDAVRVHPAPVAASEGPIAFALGPGAEPGPLVVSSVYYEFVPADEPVRPDSPTLRFDELDDGGEYHVLLSHAGGLWRYAVGDVVRVAGFLHGVPCVEYAGRGTPAELDGVRVREACVVDALAGAAADTGCSLVNATCRPARDGAGRACLEVALEPAGPVDVASLAKALDRRLTRRSRAYGDARASGRLAPARLHVTAADAFMCEWVHRVEAGNRPPQVKDRVFWTDDDGWLRLLGSTATAAAR